MISEDTKLSDIAFACYVYKIINDYDKAYINFLNEVQGSLDLSNNKHRKALLEWLNNWGCRQFAIKYHNEASKSIENWYNIYSKKLRDYDIDIIHFDEKKAEFIGRAFEDLSKCFASYRIKKSGEKKKVTIGPTGATKILFAIKPNELMPWDGAIRSGKYNGTKESYIDFLNYVKMLCRSIEEKCKKHGYKLSDLPGIIDREKSTIPKIIDEYLWITKTRDFIPPTNAILEKWVEMSK